MNINIHHTREKIDIKEYLYIWQLQDATSVAEVPVAPVFVKYRCRVNDFDTAKTYPSRAVDFTSQKFLFSNDDGAQSISYIKLLNSKGLRDEMLEERKVRSMGRRRPKPHVIVEHCTNCDCRVIKDGCKEFLDLLHRRQNPEILVTEVSGSDWAHSIYDMRLACVCSK